MKGPNTIPEESTRSLIKQQIMDIRDSGLTNMLDVKAVQRIAFEREYCELVNFIESNPSNYVGFIIGGKEELLSD